MYVCIYIAFLGVYRSPSSFSVVCLLCTIQSSFSFCIVIVNFFSFGSFRFSFFFSPFLERILAFFFFFFFLSLPYASIHWRKNKIKKPELLRRPAATNSTFQKKDFIYFGLFPVDIYLERVIFPLCLCYFSTSSTISVSSFGDQKNNAFKLHQRIATSVLSFPVFALMGSTATCQILTRPW